MVTRNDDLLICRCGEVSRSEVIAALREGARTVDEVKRMTRAGMGICQGRTCARLVAQLIHEELGIPLDQIALPRARAPVRPVAAKTISAIEPPRGAKGRQP